jgi:hypothetical protein
MNSVDFEYIKKLNEEIEALLNERPEYREMIEDVRREIDRQAGNNKHNRCAIAIDIMMTKWLEILDQHEKLKNP